jgi:hypothetical protein
VSFAYIPKMDFETQRKKRMEALDEKRRRLEEMRKMRKDRTETVDELQDSQQGPSDERTKVDNLVNSLLISSLSDTVIESNSPADVVSPRYYYHHRTAKLFSVP